MIDARSSKDSAGGCPFAHRNQRPQSGETRFRGLRRSFVAAVVMLLLGLPNIHNPLRADGLWSHLFGRHRKCACPTTECPMHRAGHPETVAWYAIPRNSGRYWGYYVGGGAPVKKGDPRGVHEGVWGWDWVGRAIQPKVELNWWHGRKYQGGAGAYKTDGPHFKHKK